MPHLDGGTHCDDFIGIDALEGFLLEELLDSFHNLGHTGHTTNEDDFADLAQAHTRVLDTLLAGFNGSGNQVVNKGFHLIDTLS
jgi:hypothetical protein